MARGTWFFPKVFKDSNVLANLGLECWKL